MTTVLFHLANVGLMVPAWARICGLRELSSVEGKFENQEI